jgi:hypothetical protein
MGKQTAGLLSKERIRLHAELCNPERGCLFISKTKGGHTPTNADEGSALSRNMALALSRSLRSPVPTGKRLDGQTAGRRFEVLIANFLQRTFSQLTHLRPGDWTISDSIGRDGITQFRQFEHLAYLASRVAEDPELKAALGEGYLIKPDIAVFRKPLSDAEINRKQLIVDETSAQSADLRASSNPSPLLHANISQKWTIRSDRVQNSRSEALNLIRLRKGHAPHIVVVTGEPMPSRIAAIALGTGDIDCVYHFALPELVKAAKDLKAEDALEMLKVLIDGRRLKDISDLPLDLAV